MRIDIEGQRFGKWTVGSFSHCDGEIAFWNAACDCGTKKTVRGIELRRGRSTQCTRCRNSDKAGMGHYKKSKGMPVYFIRSGDYVKIGASNNIPNRLNQLKANNPYPITLIATDEENGSERFWHKIFAHRHHRGEWYYMPQIVFKGKINE